MFQFCTSLKELLDNWNKSTTAWLRYVVYERLNSTLAVNIFSALWHGFYAGYYVTFLTGGILIHTARLVSAGSVGISLYFIFCNDPFQGGRFYYIS